jgi:hypothetical protein
MAEKGCSVKRAFVPPMLSLSLGIVWPTRYRQNAMRHRKWVSAQQLDRWAETNDARLRLPELLRRLVHGTVEPSDIEHVDFPAGEETHRPGYDGVTKLRRGNAKVPDGITYWEVSADSGVKTKLDRDFENRLRDRGTGDFSEVTYIGVTPRDYQDKRRWAEEKTALDSWREVRAYDSDDLEQWLELAPSVALWLSRYVATPPDGLVDLSTHWENIQAALSRRLPPSALLVSRDQLVESLRTWLNGSPQELVVHAQSPQEVVDVFAAWVQSLSESEQDPIASRSIIVESVDGLRELVDSTQRLVLICSDRLEINENLVAEARRKGHHILLPVSLARAARDALRMERMNRFELQKILHQAGLPEDEAYSITQHSGGSFSILKRRLASVSLISTPKWGKGREAEELAPLLLAGAWQDGRTADQAVIATLAGRQYAEARNVVTRWRSEADAPIRWADGMWEFISPLDAWHFLHHALSPAHLDTWEKVVADVLGVDDPRLELPPDERWQAKVHGKEFDHSDDLRLGLARTLALVATRDAESSMTDVISLQTRVNRVVRKILPDGVGWQRWASLGSLLPLIAEAAPEMLLDAIEADLRSGQPQLPELFRQEGTGVTGWAEHTGLLWALERVAWSRTFLARATLALARLEELDPGGNWANRPRASLRDIFFSWMPHTAASVEQRLEVVEVLMNRHPAVGWNLLLDLLPQFSESIMNHPTPEWRFWAEGWQRGVTRADYSRTITGLIHLAVASANEHPERWPELIERLPQWPRAEFDHATEALDRLAGSGLPANVRRELWTSLLKHTRLHRYFSDADWALPDEALTRLEAILDRLAPEDPVELAVPLFVEGFEIAGDNRLPWEEQERIRLQKRHEAIQAILGREGFAGVLRLARQAKNPWDVGFALADVAGADYDADVLPNLLCCGEKSIEHFAVYYTVRRMTQAGRDWAESLPIGEWQREQAATLVAHMPFDPRTWDFVARCGAELETEYWRRTNYLAVGLSEEAIARGVNRLIEVDRPAGAIRLLAFTTRGSEGLKAPILFDLLEHALSTAPEEGDPALQAHDLQPLLERLQRADDVDETRLARFEWALLPALHSHLVHAVTLHNALARDPGFFVELLTVLYRPRRRDGAEERGGGTTEIDDATRLKAQRAWRLLNEWQRVPGTTDSGTVDWEKLNSWVEAARAAARAVERLEVCDLTIGQVFAYAPNATDETWPCIPVREALERIDSRELERGFVLGVLNRRGVHSRAIGEGGRQERELAARYETYAAACETRWPRTAAALRQVKASYLADARREDEEAERER